MSGNIINPYKGSAASKIPSLQTFLELAKQESVARTLNAPPVDQLDQARSIVLGQAFSTDLLDSTFKLYKTLIAKGVRDLKVRTYLFSTGIDMAIRGQQGPFLIAASTLIKKLLQSEHIDKLAEFVDQILDSPNQSDLDKIVEYFRKSPVASMVPPGKLRRKIQDSINQKSINIGMEAEAHADALRAAGYTEWEIPGSLVALGYLAGLVATKIIPEAYSDS